MRARRGYTLIEVLVAMLIVSGGIVAYMTALGATQVASSRAWDRASALALAEAQIARLRTMPSEQIALRNGDTTVASDYTGTPGDEPRGNCPPEITTLATSNTCALDAAAPATALVVDTASGLAPIERTACNPTQALSSATGTYDPRVARLSPADRNLDLPSPCLTPVDSPITSVEANGGRPIIYTYVWWADPAARNHKMATVVVRFADPPGPYAETTEGRRRAMDVGSVRVTSRLSDDSGAA